MKGRTDDFRELGRRLYIVAAELESGRSVVFGKPGRDHVAISRAVQASSALPGLYPPVDIDGHFYVDGVLNRTVHASVALDAGAKLLFCINPIVPVDVSTDKAAGLYAEGELLRRGLPSVLSQTFRTLIHSRLDVGMKRYDSLYEDADVILLEPDRDDYEMFFSNIFSFSERSAVCAHAYESTRRDLLKPVRPAGADHRAPRPEVAARHPGGQLARALARSRTGQFGRRCSGEERRQPGVEPRDSGAARQCSRPAPGLSRTLTSSPASPAGGDRPAESGDPGRTRVIAFFGCRPETSSGAVCGAPFSACSAGSPPRPGRQRARDRRVRPTFCSSPSTLCAPTCRAATADRRGRHGSTRWRRAGCASPTP